MATLPQDVMDALSHAEDLLDGAQQQADQANQLQASAAAARSQADAALLTSHQAQADANAAAADAIAKLKAHFGLDATAPPVPTLAPTPATP